MSRNHMGAKLKIAATGLSGLVGARMRALTDNEFEWIDLNESMLDITRKDEVASCIKNLNADLLLHLAAFTDVDGCENNKDRAWQINVEGTRNLFVSAQGKKIKFIYVSTGFVFDGDNPPYYEDSVPNPISHYGTTKYEGEKIVGNGGMIIRIDYPYGSTVAHKKDVVGSLLDLLKENKPIKGVVDQILTPTFIDDIAHAFVHLVANFDPSIFHLVGANSLSGYELIKTIGREFNIDTSSVLQTTYDEFYRDKARRPRNDIVKTKKNNFYPMKSFEEG